MDDPAEFVSHLPVAQDGTCNGFQHYSAIGRDSLGAQYVNVTPGPRPNDLYTSIMHLAESLIDKDIEAESENFERLRIASLSKSVINRGIVKRRGRQYAIPNLGSQSQICKRNPNP